MPSVQSTSTAPSPSSPPRGSAGRSIWSTRSSITGTWPKPAEPESCSGAPSVIAYPRIGSYGRAVLDLSVLVIGRVTTAANVAGSPTDRPWRWGSTPGHRSVGGLGTFAGAGARSEDGVERIVTRLRVGLLVLLDVLVPGLRIPDLQEVDRADDHTFLVQLRVTPVIGGERDPPLSVRDRKSVV